LRIEITDKRIVEYYLLFWRLATLHRDLHFGDTPRSSEKLTEKLCQEIYGFQKSGTIECDLKSDDGERIEVKGTTSKYGATSINKELMFDWLYWVDMSEQNLLRFYKIKREHFVNYFGKHEGKNKERPILPLSKFRDLSDGCDIFKVNAESMTIEQLSANKKISA
jgi:hypothetical protein